MAVEHLHEAGVDAVREARVVFDLRAGFSHRRVSTSSTTCTACGLPIETVRHQHGLPGRSRAP
jgi:hypothetical protein